MGLYVRAGIYNDLLASVRRSLKISVRWFSISLVDCMGVTQPTPFCQIAYVTLFFDRSTCGNVKPTKNRRSIRVSMSSSPSGLLYSIVSFFSSFSFSSRASEFKPSKSTSGVLCGSFFGCFLLCQKNLSSHDSNCSASKRNGKTRVMIRMQFKASFAGARS